MRVLLLTPSTFGYEIRIQDAFARIGHDVTWMDERVGNSFATKVATRLGLLHRIPSLVGRHVDKIISQAKISDVEQLIAINPETLQGSEFAKIKAALPELDIVIYRWDSLAQKPVDEEMMAAASAVYSFDPADCDRDARLRHLPLFHTYSTPPSPHDKKNAEFYVSFVGTAQLRRIAVLGRLCKALNAARKPYFFHLKTQSWIHQALFWFAARRHGYTGSLTQKQLPYDSFLKVITNSAAVVDIEFKRQSGLTMRTFEVVFSGMPLLTSNANITRYGFYGDAPIFVIDDSELSLPDLSTFKSIGISSHFEQYSIESWAKTLVEMLPDQNYFTDSPLRANSND